MGDILKEAIADAKAVRETALQNAKMALEEAFTPQLKSMLSAKLKEDDMEDEFGGEEEFGDEEVPTDELAYEDDPFGDEEGEVPGEVPVEEPALEDDPFGDEAGEEEFGQEDELDLEAIIRELEQELSGRHGGLGEENLGNGDPDSTDNAYSEDGEYDIKEGDSPESADNAHSEGDPGEDSRHVTDKPLDGSGPLKEEEDEDKDKEDVTEDSHNDDDDVEIDESLFNEIDDEDEDKVEEQSKSSGIGKGDNAGHYASSSDEEDPEGGPGVKQEPMDGSGPLKELAEYKQAVHFLKNKLHEVNILNAKLLFTNKLFKEYILDNNQKLKVVETFDRAQTTREIKLVYTTLAEQFKDNNGIDRKTIKESASSAVGSTKPSQKSRKVITEEQQVADRFRKLAGLIK